LHSGFGEAPIVMGRSVATVFQSNTLQHSYGQGPPTHAAVSVAAAIQRSCPLAAVAKRDA
jgi:hypothetical protein